MAGTKRPLPSHSAKAAYAASQPLFTTLRASVAAIDDQKRLLTTARDTVQKVHVKLAAESTTENSDEHARYVNAVVNAWKVAAESYAGIFGELANITAADATEGKIAKPGHKRLVAMKKMAASAANGAKGFPMFDEGGKGTGGAGEVEMKDADDTEAIGRPAKRVKTSIPGEVNGTGAAGATAAQAGNGQQRASVGVDLPAAQGGVEFEDITAEVDARLAAKKLKKKEKKRKRQSEQSMETEATHEGTAVMPSSKKIKSGHADTSVEHQMMAIKKRAHESGGVEEGGRKRKKGKA